MAGIKSGRTVRGHSGSSGGSQGDVNKRGSGNANKHASARRSGTGSQSSGGQRGASDAGASARRYNSGLLVFIASLVIVLIGLIQLLSAFHTYAVNLSQLNELKRQEASLVVQKQDLENDIARWNDKAYVTAQARDRLGFVFPGEQVVHVEHPEAVTGEVNKNKDHKDAQPDEQKKLPWYSELAYSLKKADTPLPKADTVKSQPQ